MLICVHRSGLHILKRLIEKYIVTDLKALIQYPYILPYSIRSSPDPSVLSRHLQPETSILHQNSLSMTAMLWASFPKSCPVGWAGFDPGSPHSDLEPLPGGKYRSDYLG